MRIRIAEKRKYQEPISSRKENLAGFSGMTEIPGKGLLSYLAAGLAVLAAVGVVVFALAFLLLAALPILLICGGVFLWRQRRLLFAGREFLRRHRTKSARGPFARANPDDDVIDV